MKKLLYFLLLLVFNTQLYAADPQQSSHNYLVSLREDNDCLNLPGKSSDDAYSNGTRLDFFYIPKHNSPLFIDSWMPKAGKDSKNIYGFSLAQDMYTPRNLASKNFQGQDYPYSGLLYITHSLYSYNRQKKYDFQTEMVAGIIGSHAYARQLQTAVHSIIDCQRPMGWSNQFKNDLLLNLNFAAEKELLSYHNTLDIIGGSKVSVGTMEDALNAYTTIRIGKLSSYFDGIIDQYSPRRTKEGGHPKMAAYFFLRPGVKYELRNAALQGGMFTDLPVANANTDNPVREQYSSIENIVASVAYGFAVNYGSLGFSYSETTTTPTMKGLYAHTVGNLSFFYSW